MFIYLQGFQDDRRLGIKKSKANQMNQTNQTFPTNQPT